MSRGAHLIRWSAPALGAAVLLLAGCAVQVDAPEVPQATRSACARFVADLPARVSEQSRRTVDDAKQGAAWGDPAIVVRCGVGTPDGFTPSATCVGVDGVGWYIPQAQLDTVPDVYTITTIGRSPRVEVTVPKQYLPPATTPAVLVDLAKAVKAGTRETRPCR